MRRTCHGRGAGLGHRGPGGARPPRHANAAATAVFVQLALRCGRNWAAQCHLTRAVGKRFRGCRAKRLYVNIKGAMLTDEDDQDGRFFFNPPERKLYVSFDCSTPPAEGTNRLVAAWRAAKPLLVREFFGSWVPLSRPPGVRARLSLARPRRRPAKRKLRRWAGPLRTLVVL